jgi:hypothetical protein
LIARYEKEVGEFPEFLPSERLLNAAKALHALVRGGADAGERSSLLEALEQGKTDGTVGYELWFWGTEWIAQRKE